MRKRIISQAKDLKVLSKASVKSSVAKFKEQYLGLKDSDECPLCGFELKGGERMTSEGEKVWNEFKQWCDERGLKCDYQTNSDLRKIRDNLAQRVHQEIKVIAM